MRINEIQYQEELKNIKKQLSSNNCGNITKRMENNLDDYNNIKKMRRFYIYEFENKIKYIKYNNNCGSQTIEMKEKEIEYNSKKNNKIIKNKYNCGISTNQMIENGLKYEAMNKEFLFIKLEQYLKKLKKTFQNKIKKGKNAFIISHVNIEQEDIKNQINNQQKSEEKKEVVNNDIIMELNKIINKYQIRIEEIDKFLNNINNFEGTLYKDFIICYNYSPGEIYIFNLNDTKKYRIDIRKTLKSYILPYKLDNSEITAISINKYFLFGTQLGSIMIYKLGKN